MCRLLADLTRLTRSLDTDMFEAHQQEHTVEALAKPQASGTSVAVVSSLLWDICITALARSGRPPRSAKSAIDIETLSSLWRYNPTWHSRRDRSQGEDTLLASFCQFVGFALDANGPRPEASQYFLQLVSLSDRGMLHVATQIL